jgi:citrate synthase
MTSTWLTAHQVAQRLGVKPATVYAYVSRGLLPRQMADDGRSSRFDPAEVEALARRSRPRTDARRTGIVDVVLSTTLTEIRGGELRYRGHDAVELVGSSTFEDVAELLWTGHLTDRARWSAPAKDVTLVRNVTAPLGPGVTPADRIRVGTAAVASSRPLRVDLRSESVTHHARTLLATLVDALPPIRRSRTTTTPVGRSAGGRPPRLAARLWPKVARVAVNPARTRALDAALILLADHELASSTLAARIAASTRSDPYDVVLSGLGAVSGPLHGGAGAAAHRLLTHAKSSGSPERAVGEALSLNGALPGFGHPLYPDGDPRARCLLGLLAPLLGPHDTALVEATLAAAAVTSAEPPNVDFALAALAFSAGMSTDAIEVIFALARISGWIGHALEEYAETPLRFRTRAIYVGV